MLTIWKDWLNSFKGYNRNVRLILWTNLLFQIGIGMFIIMYNLYVRAAGHDQVVVGKVVSMMSLATAIALIPAGILSDRFGRKKIIIIGGVATVLTLGLRSILVSESGLLSTAFIEGMFAALIQVSFLPLLSENSTSEQRVQLFSFMFALGMVAAVIGNIGGGFIADFFQYVIGLSELVSIRITLLIGTGFVALTLFPILAVKEEKKRTNTTGKERPSLKQFITNNKSSLKVIVLFSIAQMLIGFGAGLVIPYLNLYFSDRFAASKSTIGIVVSLGQAATAIAMVIGPFIVKRVGAIRAIVLFQLSSIPFLLLTGFTNSLLIASFGYLFRQALMNAANPVQMSIMMDRVDDSMKGLANSVGSMNFQLGWALMGPVSTSIVAAHGSYWGYAYVFSITTVLYIIGSFYFYFVFREKKTTPEISNA